MPIGEPGQRIGNKNVFSNFEGRQWLSEIERLEKKEKELEVSVAARSWRLCSPYKRMSCAVLHLCAMYYAGD